MCSNAQHRYCTREMSFDRALKWMCDYCQHVANQMYDLDSFGMIPEIKPEVEMVEDHPFQPFQLHVKEEVFEMDDVPPFTTEVKEEVVEPDFVPIISQLGPVMVSNADMHLEPMEVIDGAVEIGVYKPTARRSPRKRKFNKKYFSGEIVVKMNFNWLLTRDEGN
ncbi:unnamed protein product [Cuscuta europaea]|uniref:Uncharacterized protein n=1 Tax=Cuscuta europaea TaxID=41803 RepID=A0A9P0Z7F5_CUSEU|nr:unnamed protein product [Cuscuta europaea]